MSSFYDQEILAFYRQQCSVSGEEMFLVVRDGINLGPAPLSDPSLVDSLISGPIGEDEDEDPVTLSAQPTAVQEVSIRKCLISRPVLKSLPPGSSEDVTVSKVVGAVSVSE